MPCLYSSSHSLHENLNIARVFLQKTFPSLRSIKRVTLNYIFPQAWCNIACLAQDSSYISTLFLLLFSKWVLIIARVLANMRLLLVLRLQETLALSTTAYPALHLKLELPQILQA